MVRGQEGQVWGRAGAISEEFPQENLQIGVSYGQFFMVPEDLAVLDWWGVMGVVAVKPEALQDEFQEGHEDACKMSVDDSGLAQENHWNFKGVLKNLVEVVPAGVGVGEVGLGAVGGVWWADRLEWRVEIDSEAWSRDTRAWVDAAWVVVVRAGADGGAGRRDVAWSFVNRARVGTPGQASLLLLLLPSLFAKLGGRYGRELRSVSANRVRRTGTEYQANASRPCRR